MGLAFYPHSDDAQKGTLNERVEVLLDAARKYKALVLDHGTKVSEGGEIDASNDSMLRIRCSVPREIEHSYNWEDIAIVLREIHDLPEASKEDKNTKSHFLAHLAEVYEVLRGAKMSKLEAVRLALINESKQLQGGSTSQVG